MPPGTTTSIQGLLLQASDRGIEPTTVSRNALLSAYDSCISMAILVDSSGSKPYLNSEPNVRQPSKPSWQGCPSKAGGKRGLAGPSPKTS